MVALPLLTALCERMEDLPLPAAVANATKVLHSNDLEHLLFVGRASSLTRHPTPGVVEAEEFGSDMPRDTAQRAAVALDVVVADGVTRVWRRCHVRST